MTIKCSCGSDIEVPRGTKKIVCPNCYRTIKTKKMTRSVGDRVEIKKDIRSNCQTCQVHLREITEELSCCKWYMDNVVFGDKTPSECTEKVNL